jgi:hypothetical protein
MGPPDFVKRMLDFNRLLEGENRDSNDPEDAAHWHAVYRELIAFKERLLSSTKQEIKKLPETRQELGAHDVPFLEAELNRLRRGLDFWSERLPKRDKPR